MAALVSVNVTGATTVTKKMSTSGYIITVGMSIWLLWDLWATLLGGGIEASESWWIRGAMEMHPSIYCILFFYLGHFMANMVPDKPQPVEVEKSE